MQDKLIVILTGAGISAESGLSTFRDNGGLWCEHRIEDVATPEAFKRNPELVHDFYNIRRMQLAAAQPNAAHHALSQLAEQWEGRFLLITQNVDDLHEKADMQTSVSARYQLLHMHGELLKARCESCGIVYRLADSLDKSKPCPNCNVSGGLRPHIVWFGEMPIGMDTIYHHLNQCDLFISIGTSGNVYPAAGFIQEVRGRGKAHTVELNMERSAGHSLFQERIYGPATEIVPSYVKRILDGKVI